MIFSTWKSFPLSMVAIALLVGWFRSQSLGSNGGSGGVTPPDIAFFSSLLFRLSSSSSSHQYHYGSIFSSLSSSFSSGGGGSGGGGGLESSSSSSSTTTKSSYDDSYIVPEIPDDFQPIPPSQFETFITLPGTGDQLPQSGLGITTELKIFSSSHNHNNVDSCEMIRRIVLWYIVLGGRHIDTTAIISASSGGSSGSGTSGQKYHEYLQSIGQAIQDAEFIYGIPRSLLFITTKIATKDFGYFNTFKSLPRLLDDLGLEYIDLLLLPSSSSSSASIASSSTELVGSLFQSHLRGGTECTDYGQNTFQCRAATWKAMILAKRKGVTRNIGLSNFNIQQIQELQSIDSISSSSIAINQIMFHPWIPQSLYDIYEFCHHQQQKIPTLSYSNLLGSLLQTQEAITQPMIQQIASSYNRTEAQILLRWSIQYQYQHEEEGNNNNAIISSTQNPIHMIENLEIYDFVLTENDMNRISTLRTDIESTSQFFS